MSDFPIINPRKKYISVLLNFSYKKRNRGEEKILGFLPFIDFFWVFFTDRYVYLHVLISTAKSDGNSNPGQTRVVCSHH